MSPKGIFQVILWCGGSLLVVLVFGLVATNIGKYHPIFPVTLWGTVADWVMAIVPAIAIVASVNFWISDRDERRLATETRSLRRIRLIHAYGETFFDNRSHVHVSLVPDPGASFSRYLFSPGVKDSVGSSDIGEVCFHAFGRLWKLGIGGVAESA